MNTFKVKIKNLGQFESLVFGADCFIKHFPEILTTGVDVALIQGRCYVIRDNKIVHDTTFFTVEEMKTLELVKTD